MRTLLTLALLFSFTVNATCDWKTITKVGDKYSYTEECHLEVGDMVKDIPLYQEKNRKLQYAIEEQEKALEIAGKRIELWRDQAYKSEDRIISLQKSQKYNDILFFVAGFLTVMASAWVVEKVK